MTDKKKPGDYDRIIIAILEDEPVFSWLPVNYVSQDGQSLATITHPVKITKRMQNIERKLIHQFVLDNVDKDFRVFARVEKGTPQLRVEQLIATFNKEIMEKPIEERKDFYDDDMVENWFEKIMHDKTYPRKTGNTWNMQPLKHYDLRRPARELDIDTLITDEGGESETPRDVEPGIRTLRSSSKKDVETKSSSARTNPPEIQRATVSNPASQQSSAESTAANPLDVAFNESSQGSQEDIFASSQTATAPRATSLVVNVPVVETPPQVVATSPPEQQQETVSVLVGAAANEQADAANQDADTYDQQGETDASTTFGGHYEPTSLPGASTATDQLSSVFMEIPTLQASSFVTRDYLTRKLEFFKDEIVESVTDAVQEMIQIEREAANKERDKAWNKKIDNKFEKVNAIFKLCQEINNRSITMSATAHQQSPVKTLRGNQELKARARSILFRPIPFNIMGKACDAYFSFPLVQEQLADFLSPYLNRLELVGMNNVLARTILDTFFTPLARAHLIYGKNKNSTKMQEFYKRPLPAGIFNMIDKNILLQIQDALKLTPGADLGHISDLRAAFANAFNVDRGAFFTCAASNTLNRTEAATACKLSDLEFYESNKHTLPKSTLKKLKKEMETHFSQLFKRKELEECDETTDFVDATKDLTTIFHEMKSKCVVQITDMREIIKIILGMDYRRLQVDDNEHVPELRNIYNSVVNEITNINDVIKTLSADAANYLPQVYVNTQVRPQASSSRKKKAVMPFTGLAKRARLQAQEQLQLDLSTPEQEVANTEVQAETEQEAAIVYDQSDVLSDYGDDNEPMPGPSQVNPAPPPVQQQPEIPPGVLSESSSGSASPKKAKN